MVAFAQVPPVPPEVEHVAKTVITRGALEAPIRFLASDLLEGRGPATRGDLLARQYLASALEALGYQPAGPRGQWEQPFDVGTLENQLDQSLARGRVAQIDHNTALLTIQRMKER